jgi:hypothetical protein
MEIHPVVAKRRQERLEVLNIDLAYAWNVWFDACELDEHGVEASEAQLAVRALEERIAEIRYPSENIPMQRQSTDLPGRSDTSGHLIPTE